MPTQPNPPSGVEPNAKPASPAPNSSPAPQKSGPGGLSGGVETGANAPGQTGRGGRQDF